MRLASALNSPPMAYHLLPSQSLLFSNPRPPSNLCLPHRRLLLLPRISSSTLTLARRRNHHGAATSSTSSPRKKTHQSLAKNRVMEDEDKMDEDAIEALFSQLEEDLKNDGGSLDEDDGEDDEDISEEDLALLEQELAEAFGADGDFNLDSDNDDVDEDEDEPPVKLKNWQLRRLALALKAGRRKTSIKSLAAELCLDRAFVLDLLREPPPSLLMMSASLPDEPAPTIPVIETKPIEMVVEKTADTAKPESKVKEPIHVFQQKFSAQKRVKKAHLETLEKVYRRTKRPTNAMISSIVYVTNLPRKRVIKWFEDRRAKDGVPVKRSPYQRSLVSS